MPLDRRAYLRTVGGVTVGLAVGTSGCLRSEGKSPETPNSPQDSSSQYEWLPASVRRKIEFSFIDIESTFENRAEDTVTIHLNEIEDPFLLGPFRALARYVVNLGGWLLNTGLGGLMDFGDKYSSIPGPGDFETDIDRAFQVHRNLVLFGDIDKKEVNERLLYPPSYDYQQRVATYEKIGSSHGFEIYATDGIRPEASLIAVGDKALVLRKHKERVSALMNFLNTRYGERPQIADVDSDVAWMLDQAGSGQTVWGEYWPGDLQAENGTIYLEELEGVVASTNTIQEERMIEGSLAGLIKNPTTDRKQQLREKLGSAAIKRSVSIDGHRVSATAKWDPEQL